VRRLTGEEGTVAIVVALALTSLLGMAALAIDVGSLLAQRGSLQGGADAAALAIAQQCAEHAVDPVAHPTPCTATAAATTADAYFAGNSPGTVTVAPPSLSVSYAGRVGSITVTGTSASPPIFARMLNVTEPIDVSARASARWGPMTAVDAAFPIGVCKGALPAVDEAFTLIVDPTAPGGYDECDGAPDEPPFSWVPVDDPDLCTSKITLLPPTYLDPTAADAPPATAGCSLEINELHNDIDGTAVCHTTPNESLHCHGSSSEADRTRVMPVYDPAGGTGGTRPSYSLVAIEFVGARLDGRASHSAGGWSGPCAVTDPTTIDDLQCIRGIVREYIPPSDGPILDPAVAAALPGIADTTVLDVRLVD
jgi:hypothetical protein